MKWRDDATIEQALSNQPGWLKEMEYICPTEATAITAAVEAESLLTTVTAGSVQCIIYCYVAVVL